MPSEEPTALPGASPGLTEPFPYGEFNDSTTIDNRWLPLAPGLRWQWEGETLDPETGETQPHRIVMVVTGLTKVIDGVTARVAWDRDFADDELVEQEIIFLAQDDSGTVWHLGQYPEEYEDGEFVDAPGWIAGVVGSQAGIWMPADPRVGDRSYSQGWGPVVGWTDRGQVIQEGLNDCVAFGCFDDVIVIEEWALDHPDARQTKFYAPGIGNIRVGWSGSAEQEQEELELIIHETVTPDQLARADETALELEARAYEILAHIYGDTEPMQLPD
jgi:hypothetical protein